MGAFKLHGLDVSTTKAVSTTKLVKMKAIRELRELQKEVLAENSYGVFVKSLPENLTWTEVKEAFSRFGEVESVRTKSILGSRHCFVEMKTAEGYDQALRNGFVELGSSTVRIYPANPLNQPAIIRIRNALLTPEEIARECKRIAVVEKVEVRTQGLVDVYFQVKDME
ncbi:hypothetical protein CBR_g73271, partial [Chara braunii]